MGKPSIIPNENGRPSALTTEASRAARSKSWTIRMLSQAILVAMQEIHGGRWSVDINHDARYVSICYDGPW